MDFINDVAIYPHISGYLVDDIIMGWKGAQDRKDK